MSPSSPSPHYVQIPDGPPHEGESRATEASVPKVEIRSLSLAVPDSRLNDASSSASNPPNAPPPFSSSTSSSSSPSPSLRTILSNVSLSVPRGSITALMGPSGSGKSTLLRCINRMWEPAPGSVHLDGCDVTSLDVVSLRRRVGMLFQSAHLFDGTVAHNVAFGPSLQGQMLTADDIDDLLAAVGLDTSFSGADVATLSGGQAQRVALARALANGPEVLLLDEPTSALDPAATLHVEETVKRLRDTNAITVVWVSHSSEQVLRVADQAVLLMEGEVVDQFIPAELGNGQHEISQRFIAGQVEAESS